MHCCRCQALLARRDDDDSETLPSERAAAIRQKFAPEQVYAFFCFLALFVFFFILFTLALRSQPCFCCPLPLCMTLTRQDSRG